MPDVTVEISDEDLARYERWAEYRGDELQQLLADVMAFAKREHRGSMVVEVVVPESELKRWHAEARRRGYYVPEWLRRMGNFVTATGVTEGHTFERHGAGTAFWIGTCAWCNAELPEHCSARKVFCSDLCRVRSWRAQREQDAKPVEGSGAA